MTMAAWFSAHDDEHQGRFSAPCPSSTCATNSRPFCSGLPFPSGRGRHTVHPAGVDDRLAGGLPSTPMRFGKQLPFLLS